MLLTEDESSWHAIQIARPSERYCEKKDVQNNLNKSRERVFVFFNNKKQTKFLHISYFVKSDFVTIKRITWDISYGRHFESLWFYPNVLIYNLTICREEIFPFCRPIHTLHYSHSTFGSTNQIVCKLPSYKLSWRLLCRIPNFRWRQRQRHKSFYFLIYFEKITYREKCNYAILKIRNTWILLMK